MKYYMRNISSDRIAVPGGVSFYLLVSFLLGSTSVYGQTVRIACGSTTTFQDSTGTNWSGDQYYTGGQPEYRGANKSLDSSLSRWSRTGKGGNFSYSIPLTNGTYSVTLRFANTDFTQPGTRVFNVLINGSPALTNFELIAAPGANAVVDKTFSIPVTQGGLRIDVINVVQYGVLNAIQIVPASSNPSPPPSNPILTTSLTSLAFSGTAGGANPASQAIGITNSGSGTLNWSASKTQSWLSLSAASGTAPSSFAVTANTKGLGAGTYTDTVTIGVPGGTGSQTVNVTLNVSSQPAVLSVSPSSLSFSATAGGANPAPQTIGIANSGGGTLNWSASNTQSWLSLSAAPGTVPASLAVTANTKGLGAGTYTDTVTIGVLGGTGSQTVNVTLNVASQPAVLSVSTSSLSFSATAGGANPAFQTIGITKSGGGTVNWSANKTQPWLSLSPATGTAPSSLAVAANTSGLAAGVYTDTVTINADGSTAAPQTVVVTLNISGSSGTFGGTLLSSISIDSLDTTSFRVLYTASSPSWMEVKYGTVSGVYPYNTKSVKCFDAMPACQWTVGKGALTVSGLTPGTTYYVRVTARPNPDDDANICATEACGSVEQAVTTNYSNQQDAPIAPAAWVPVLPDTSSYTVIRLQTGASGECQASSNVVSRDGWSVAAGDTLGTILSKIGYGTVIELPQGIKCKVPSVGGYKGYSLPDKGLDWLGCAGTCSMTDPRHRWIVFRTQQLTAGDFPAFGSRTDPSFASKLGKFYSSQPNRASQLFDAENGSNTVHHFWFQNIELEDDENYQNPVDAVDPDAFAYFMRLGSQYQAGVNNQFVVLDRVYAHGPGAPIRHWQGFELGGNYQAMIGCYTSKVEVSHITVWPVNPGTLSSNQTVLNIPQNNYRLGSNTALLGMSGSAMVQMTSVTGSGSVVGNLYKDHLEIQYTSSAASLICSGCNATATSNPSTPSTAMQLFHGSISAAGFTGINWNTAEWATSRYPMAFGVVFSDLRAAGGPYLFDNNYLDGVGEGFYIDPNWSDFAHDDVTYTHNHQIWPKSYFSGDPGNVWRYDVRQHMEIKRGHRFLLRGNVFSYSWSYQNDGPAILLSGRPTYTAQSRNDGISDIQIVSNQISHLRTPIECMSANPMDNGGGQNEGAVTKRVSITNNLMFDLGRWKYCDSINCPSLTSVYFMNRPGCQDLTIRNNTGGPTYGEIPSLLFVGGGQLQGNSLTFEKNILHFSKGLGGYGGGSVGDWPANNVANHDVKPAAVYDNYGVAPNFKANLDASFVNIAATVTPNYHWSNNILIGGWTGNESQSTTDLTYADLTSYAANMPGGDIYPTGDSMAARQAAAGLDTTTWRSSVYNPAGVGADIDVLNADLGRVTGVQQPRPAGTSAMFAYTAPDAKACTVDVSADGVRWIRTVDGGGARGRSVTVTGLSNATTYHSRILCYYQQQNDGVLYTDYSPDQITVATFTTLVSGQ